MWESPNVVVPKIISLKDIKAKMVRSKLNSIPSSYQEAWLGTQLTPRQRLAAEKALTSKKPTSAVLVGLFEDDLGNVKTILTRRSNKLRSHTGEVSFPGGRVEVGESLDHAAIREAHEEVGIAPGWVAAYGHLEAMPTVASGSWIVPIVGFLDSSFFPGGVPRYQINPDEVERAFDIALTELMEPGVFREEIWEFPGFGEGPVGFFEVEGDTIWGATARILKNLLELLLGAETP